MQVQNLSPNMWHNKQHVIVCNDDYHTAKDGSCSLPCWSSYRGQEEPLRVEG